MQYETNDNSRKPVGHMVRPGRAPGLRVPTPDWHKREQQLDSKSERLDAVLDRLQEDLNEIREIIRGDH